MFFQSVITGRFSVKNPLLWLSASLFLTGATGLISQYVLATISSYLTGDTVEQFSVTVAVMMGFMGIGSLWQKRFEDRVLANVFIAVEVVLSLLIGFSPLIVYWAYTTDFYEIFYFLIVATTGLLIGLEIPLIIRINKKFMPEIKQNVGWVFSLDYFGAMIGGGLVWTFIILPHINIIQAGFIAGSLNVIVAMVTWFMLGQRQRSVYGVFALIITLMVAGYTFSPKLKDIIEQGMYADPIVSDTDTPYQHIVMTKRDDDLRMFINGNIQFSSKDEKRYHEFLIHPVMNMVEHPDAVLVFGGGDGLAVRELNKYVAKGLTNNITLVDIDKKMIEYASINPYLTALNQNAFTRFDIIDRDFNTEMLSGYKIVIDDATAFINKVKKSNKRFDVVIMDLPDPSSLQIAKMYSTEFFKSLRHVMDKKGALVVQSTSPFFAKDVFLSIGETLSASGFKTIPYRFNIPSFGEWGWWIACKTECNLPEKSIRVDTDFITDTLFKASTVWGKGELEGHAEINSLIHPVIVKMYQKSIWK